MHNYPPILNYWILWKRAIGLTSHTYRNVDVIVIVVTYKLKSLLCICLCGMPNLQQAHHTKVEFVLPWRACNTSAVRSSFFDGISILTSGPSCEHLQQILVFTYIICLETTGFIYFPLPSLCELQWGPDKWDSIQVGFSCKWDSLDGTKA